MKTIKLTKGYEVIVDDEDFEYLSKFKWHVWVKKNGKPYAYATIPIHRMIFKESVKYLGNEHIDHKNGDGLDNRKNNLRLCDSGKNMMNRSVNSNKKSSKFKGVYLNGKSKINPFYSMISFRKKNYRLGQFKTEKEAAIAYDKKAIELCGDFARLNYPNL